MAKVKIKGKKVTGTKKKDKIIWSKSKAWNKNLTVYAGKGNDIINFKKSKKKNKLYGQNGNDTIYGGKKNDTIDGGNGNDKIYGTAGNNQLKGGAGNDIIIGGKGNDLIWGGSGNDTINAGKGNNTIYLNKNEGTDTIQNGGGKDTLIFSQERNFDNFIFTNSGDDLNIKANGTTAVLKGYNAGKSSVKTIKAGNLSFNNIVKSTADSYEIYGTNGNDLFLFNDDNSHKIYTKGGNDILQLNGYAYYYVYGAQGNDYIDASKAYSTTLYLGGISGNDTILPNWGYSTSLNFRKNEDDSYSNRYQMIRQLNLGSEDYNYILGQKSGNDLIMKAINGKTVTVKGFWGGDNYSRIQLNDYDDSSIYLYRGRNTHIFFATPEAVHLTATPATFNGAQNKYIYGYDNVGYNLTMNNVSYNNINVYGAGSVNINIQNAKENTVGVGSAILNYTFGGTDNYLYISNANDGSVVNITGNNNYIETDDIENSTFNLSGNGNYLELEAGNYERSVTMTVNTQGSNEVSLYADSTAEYNTGGITWNVNSKGADKFNQTDYGNAYFTYNYNFAGSAGKNKYIDGGYYNLTTISGVADAGEIKISTDRTRGYVIGHNNGDNYITVSDYDMSAMDFHYNTCGTQYYAYGPNIKIYGTEANAADLNTAAFANKIKLNKDGSDGEYKSLNNIAQYFEAYNSFTFGSETHGYMSNLTKDYIVKGYGTYNTTYSDFTFNKGRHLLLDGGGDEDKLTINEEISDVRVLFNIKNDCSYDSDLYFLKSSEYLNFMKGADVSGYLHVKNFFNTGKIEDVTVVTQDDSFGLSYGELTSTADGSLIQEVASWLQSDGRDYFNVNAVMNSGTDAEKAALFAIFDKHAIYTVGTMENPYWTT